MRESGLERAGAALGGILLLIAIFAPWLDLSTSFSGERLQELSPWTGILSGEGPLIVIGIVYLALLVGMLFQVAQILRNAERHSGMRSAAWVILFGLAMLTVIGFTLMMAPIGLELGYPYYHVGIDIGGWTAGAGAICLMSSAMVAAISGQRTPAEA